MPPVRAVEGRAGVLAGAGSNNTQEAIRATTQAKESGATAVLLVDCYYNGPSSLELRTEYYQRILDSVPRHSSRALCDSGAQWMCAFRG